MKRYALPAIALLIVLAMMSVLRVPGAMPTLLFFLMNAIVAATALSLAERFYGGTCRRLLLEASFLFYVAEIVIVETALGALGLLGISPILTTTCVLLSITILLSGTPLRVHAREEMESEPKAGILTTVLWSCALVVLAAMVAQAVVTPPHGWDSYTYHLHFPISWMKAGGISVIPTPFGDPSVAYSPCNGELFFLWLILPFREDFLANLGQLPFLFMGALALYGIGRRMAIGRDASSWASLLFILAPAVIAQAVHAYVDVIFTCFFVLSVELLMRYGADGKRGTLLLLATALGLFCGTKSIALPYSLLVLVPLAVIIFRRRRRPFTEIGILALCLFLLGGFWYLRNLAATGNPLYPLSLKLFGLTLFPGMYDKDALMAGYPHISTPAGAGFAALMVFGYPLALLFLCSLPLCIAALLKKRREVLPSLYLLLLPLLAVIVYAFLTPSHTPERFLLLAVPFCALYPAFATTIDRRLKAVVGCAVAACLAATVWQNPYLTNMVKFTTVTALGFGRGGIPAARPAVVWTLAAAGSFVALSTIRRRRAIRQLLCFCAGAAAALALAHASAYFSTDSYKYAYRPSRPHTSDAGFVLDDSFGYVANPNALENAWLWMDRNTKGDRIAWAGLNVPGALHGTGLKNSVAYISINAHSDWREHDYDSLFRRRRGYAPPSTLKPAYYRREADYAAWLENLRRGGIDYLFVTTLSPQERAYLRRNREGFPIEDVWARQHPDVFSLAYSSPPSLDLRDENRVRIYRLNLRAP